VAGNGSNRTLTVTAVAGRTGTATLTVTVSDRLASDTILVTVRVGATTTTASRAGGQRPAQPMHRNTL
jgi:hypothetical protein